MRQGGGHAAPHTCPGALRQGALAVVYATIVPKAQRVGGRTSCWRLDDRIHVRTSTDDGAPQERI